MISELSYTITLTRRSEPGLLMHRAVKRLTFPEAVAAAYDIRNKLGHDWRIINVSEDVKRSNSTDCPSSGTVSAAPKNKDTFFVSIGGQSENLGRTEKD
tara:strand:+ start:488 stop:784 length:297 start_codon:yes stop_codon:yes gene_type:complete